MTNGEKLDQIFPDGICPFSHNWLKSEYKQSNSDEDCISRAEALKNLALTNGKDDVYRMINSLPSIQPKPKTDVLDKIRAEIEEVQTYKMFEGEDTVYVERKDVLAIIDKYKAEKE